VEKTEHELLNSKNFGKKSLEEILLKLSEFELTLGQKITDQMKKELQEKFHHKDLTVVEAEE
jgi:DNA-directed RNA polymerase alpha subunit